MLTFGQKLYIVHCIIDLISSQQHRKHTKCQDNTQKKYFYKCPCTYIQCDKIRKEKKNVNPKQTKCLTWLKREIKFFSLHFSKFKECYFTSGVSALRLLVNRKRI